jgi:hypothetical protein
LRVIEHESVGVGMMISWYDKRVLSIIMIGMVFSTLAIIFIAIIMDMEHESWVYLISDSKTVKLELKASDDPNTVMRQTFLNQTNSTGDDKLWKEYVEESEIVDCEEYRPDGIKCILIVPVIELKKIGPDYVKLRDDSHSITTNHYVQRRE